MHEYFVYILPSKRNGTLYIGVTGNLTGRVEYHKQGKIQGFTKTYGVDRLVYYEEYQFVEDVIWREKQ